MDILLVLSQIIAGNTFQPVLHIESNACETSSECSIFVVYAQFDTLVLDPGTRLAICVL